ncbi:MAG: DinB family protein [Anaerolineae bacterium]|jgi:uncharacterized damage-inducible protein DinB|nr:DinB family protein [Anaerolineae bacterium]
MSDRVSPLIGFYQSNERSIRRHVEGLSNEDSYLQPKFEAISLNWTLGHIVQYRVMALQVTGEPFAWDVGEVSPYRRDPAGIARPGDGRALADLMTDLDATGRLLETVLSGASADTLDEVVQTHLGEKSRYDYVSRLAWHETYHVGQLGLLRSLANPVGASS